MNKIILCLLFILSFGSNLSAQQEVEKKVLLQAFWWNFEHELYPAGWANYLADLAPRLKEMGIDAVWIPPNYKNQNVSSTGYAPFDHYDLGDKFQKGWDGTDLNVRTSSGTKDEVLRMIAIMHANGIEVVQDIALNHVSNAGAANGAGGIDPEETYSLATDAGYKNFRYVCYETPRKISTSCDYYGRKGRWPKNYLNFHPHPGHNVTSGEWENSPWGPDLAYGYDAEGNGNGYGSSTIVCNPPFNCPQTCFDPDQETNYNRNQAREWMMWFTKQTGVDGFRWDAVKHFPEFVQQDFMYNCKYVLPDWAAGGTSMFNVGEWVGSKEELDAYVDAVTFANGGSEMLTGTFDFNLRGFHQSGSIKAMVTNGGSYDMSQLPAAQQDRRYSDFNGIRTHRTVPLVNNHDTFRPIVDADGNYIGWDSFNEIGGHINPYEDRLALAYAVVMAVDGNPQIFFEDLFDLGANGNRYNHDPKSTDPNTGLPARQPLVNLIWCHQNLGFKNGDYKVRSTDGGGNVWFNDGSSAQDLLVIERSGQALIGLNDRADEWQSAYVDTDFAPGTILVDYSGASTDTYTVPADGRVNVITPPVNPSQALYGYSVWGPQGAGTSPYTPQRSTLSSQEWEMANDLGDSHCKSLGQGGMLPANSCSYRIVGKIYPDAGSTSTITVYKVQEDADITLSVYDAAGQLIEQESGTSQPISLTFTASQASWHTLKVRNSDDAQPEQKVYVKADYTAPTEINAINDFALPTAAVWNGNAGTCEWDDCKNWDEGFLPTSSTMAIIPECIQIYPCIPDNWPAAQLDDRSDYVNVQDLQNQYSIRMQPNPFREGISLECRDCDGEYQVQILDVSGKILFQNQPVHFEVASRQVMDFSSKLGKGVYFIHIQQGDSFLTEKVLKM